MKLFQWLKRSLLASGGLPAVLDDNRARLVAQRSEITRELEGLALERREANADIQQKHIELSAAYAVRKNIERRRDAALRKMERVEGAVALLKGLERKAVSK